VFLAWTMTSLCAACVLYVRADSPVPEGNCTQAAPCATMQRALALVDRASCSINVEGELHGPGNTELSLRDGLSLLGGLLFGVPCIVVCCLAACLDDGSCIASDLSLLPVRCAPQAGFFGGQWFAKLAARSGTSLDVRGCVFASFTARVFQLSGGNASLALQNCTLHSNTGGVVLMANQVLAAVQKPVRF
jgi:hypothetical protein